MFFNSWNTLCLWALTFQPTLSTCLSVLFPSWQFCFFNFSCLASLLPEIWPHAFSWCFGCSALRFPCSTCIISFTYFITKIFLLLSPLPKSPPQSYHVFSCIQNTNISNRANCNSVLYQNMFSKTKTKMPALAVDAVGDIWWTDFLINGIEDFATEFP